MSYEPLDRMQIDSPFWRAEKDRRIEEQRKRAEAAEAEVGRLRGSLDTALLVACADKEVVIQQLREENDRLRAALEAVEWVGVDRSFKLCPWCRRPEALGHVPDCLRQRALRRES